MELTQAYLKSALHYDPDTGFFTWASDRSHNAKHGETAGCLSKGYRYITLLGSTWLAHRLVFIYMTGDPPLHQVDHINGRKDDNSWANLRDVPQAENGKNCRLKRANTSGISDIRWVQSKSSWWVGWRESGKRKGVRVKDFFEACCIRKSAELRNNYHQNHGRVI